MNLRSFNRNRYFILNADLSITEYRRLIFVSFVLFFRSSSSCVGSDSLSHVRVDGHLFQTRLTSLFGFLSLRIYVAENIRGNVIYCGADCTQYGAAWRVSEPIPSGIIRTWSVFEVYVPRSVSQRLNKDTLYTLSR